MFRLEAQENPLDMLVAGSASAYAQNKIAQNAEALDMRKLDSALSQINENSTTMDRLKTLSQVPERYRSQVLEIYGNMDKAQLEGSKRQGNETTEADAKLAGKTLEEYRSYSPEGRKAALKQATSKPRQSDVSIDPDQMKRIQEARNSPGFSELDEVGQYQRMTGEFGVSSKNAETEAGLKSKQLERSETRQDKAYKEQKDFIDDVTNQYTAFEKDTKPKLLQMQSIPEDKLIGPTAAKFLEAMGIPLGALEDPSSELFQKLSLDLLKGLPETYGNRILKVEVDNFLKTIPSLINSPDGRRMIASNMLKLGEMKEVFYKEMRNQQKTALDSDKPLPKDFQQRVLDNVLPQMNKVNNEFVQLSQLTSVPKGHKPFFNNSGTISFVPDNAKALEWASQNGGKRIW